MLAGVSKTQLDLQGPLPIAGVRNSNGMLAIGGAISAARSAGPDRAE